MAYPKAFIDELKRRNSLEETVGRYVSLKRSGSNMSGLCPFHSERSPSFTVYSDHYHCYGCGAGGDVITFLMKIENLDYRSAVEQLAQRAGLSVPQDDGFVTVKKEVLTRERGLLMNKLAARHFYETLMHAPDAAEARAYLEKRRLEPATIRHFGLGFAKNSFDDLLKYLQSEGFSTEEIRAGFLCGQSQKGHYYDIFRNRVMFPIIDTAGNVVAFGGRVMDDSKPKYLNSGDTPVFKKSRHLFAMNFAKDAALGDAAKKDAVSGDALSLSGKLILCEGYMDVIALHQAGFTNAVATLGTAVTSEHARFVSRYAKTVYLAYDSDQAGKNATQKAIGLLSEVGIDAKVISIVGAKDPDEYIKSYGKAAFARLLDGSAGQVDYRLGEILKKYDLELPDDKERAVNDCCAMLAGIYPAFKREIYIARLSELTELSKASLEAEVRRREKRNAASDRKKKTSEGIDTMRHYNDKINPDATRYPRAAEIEEKILGILIVYPEHYVRVEDRLQPDSFLTAFHRRVFEALVPLMKSGENDLSSLNENFTPDEMGRITAIADKRRELSGNGEEALRSLIAMLFEEKRKKEAKEGGLSFVDRINASRKKHAVDKRDKNEEE